MGLILLGGCTLLAPTEPMPHPPPPQSPGPKPNVAGVWRGAITVADCWRNQGDGPDPCNARRGRTEPLMLDIEQIDTAVPDADLRITVTAFVPAAQRTCYGTRDVGSVFFQGPIRRAADQFDVLVTFKGQLDGTRIDSLEEMVDVNVTMKGSSGWQLLGERWRFSPILRQPAIGG
jgi:hypothetical protein